MQTERDALRERVVKKCDECGRLCVCSIFRAMAPLLSQKWDDDDRPFEPEEIAAVCNHYIPASLIKILTEDAR